MRPEFSRNMLNTQIKRNKGTGTSWLGGHNGCRNYAIFMLGKMFWPDTPVISTNRRIQIFWPCNGLPIRQSELFAAFDFGLKKVDFGRAKEFGNKSIARLIE